MCTHLHNTQMLLPLSVTHLFLRRLQASQGRLRLPAPAIASEAIWPWISVEDIPLLKRDLRVRRSDRGTVAAQGTVYEALVIVFRWP
jgi:hypothetical protein